MAVGEEPAKALPGRSFQSTATQALEADDGANLGFLWIERGEKLWSEAAGAAGKSCASCHGDAASTMVGVATRYPQVRADGVALINLEGRINQCRSERQEANALPAESDDLLGLTAFVTRQSEGLTRRVDVAGRALPFFERGRTLWTERQGQLDLACAQCHDGNVGKRLRGDTISQGQSDGWPAYRLEWQKLGSLHRRLRACSIGVRAEVFEYGAPEYLALELYLAWRGRDLPITVPGVRR